MTTYTIVKEPYGQPHDAGTAEAIACEIAGSWLGFDRTGKSLRALSADSTYQSIVMLSESQLCTIFVDEERIAIWEKSLRPLAESINGHRASMHAIEQDLRQSSDSLAKRKPLTWVCTTLSKVIWIVWKSTSTFKLRCAAQS
ncbi:MAG: hypothetical protein EBU15_13945 [Betaproteobacteria bacterium]|nr:hypothetical protein [Betaproteobacteria bacterium]